MNRLILILFIVVILVSNLFAQEPVNLTIADARQRALSFNRSYLAAKEEVDKAQAEVIKARAGALPMITAGGSYTRNLSLRSFFFENDQGESVELQFGFKNNFGASISIRQPLYQGGKVFTALAIAKLYKKYALAGLEQAADNVIYNVDVLFYNVILQRARLDVLQKALEANSYNLEVVEKKYNQGLVSQYEVLRARVEKNNLLPGVLRGQSDINLAEKRLKSFLGYSLETPLTLIEEVEDTSLVAIPSLEECIDSALAHRPEMIQADYYCDITHKAIKIAKGAYYPSLDAVSTYEWQSQSDAFTLSDNISKSFTAGITLSLPIFLGGSRSGEVQERKVAYNQAQLQMKQLEDNIRLEVEEAYDNLLQAKKALDIQGTNIAEAEEGLNIANLRYKSGVGTLLEVLSAQVALTSARKAQVEAMYGFREARSRLRKVSTITGF